MWLYSATGNCLTDIARHFSAIKRGRKADALDARRGEFTHRTRPFIPAIKLTGFITAAQTVLPHTSAHPKKKVKLASEGLNDPRQPCGTASPGFGEGREGRQRLRPRQPRRTYSAEPPPRPILSNTPALQPGKAAFAVGLAPT